MDRKLELVETRVEWLIIAERDIGDGHIIIAVRKSRFFERLVANIRVGIERLGDAGGELVNFHSGDRGVAVHVVGHESDEMANAAGRFQDAPVFESEPLQCCVHGPDHARRGVVGVER